MIKIFLTLLFIGLSFSTSHAFNPLLVFSGEPATGGGTGCVSSTLDSASTTILICEDFDAGGSGVDCDGGGAGTDSNCWNAWVIESGAFDYQGAGIEGTYSITMPSANTSAYKGVAASDDIYFFGKIKATTTSSTRSVVRLSEGAGKTECDVWLQSDNLLYVTNGTINVTTSGSLSDNTEYYIWAGYNKGTGADGYSYVAFSTTTTKPSICNPAGTTCSAAGSAAIANGDATDAVDRFYVGPFASGMIFFLDRMRVDVSDFGSNPN